MGNKDDANAAGGGGGGGGGGGAATGAGGAMTAAGPDPSMGDDPSLGGGRPVGSLMNSGGRNSQSGILANELMGIFSMFGGGYGASGGGRVGGGDRKDGPMMAPKPKNRGGPGPGSTANSPPSADPTPPPPAAAPVDTPPASQVPSSPTDAPQPPTSSMPLVPLQPLGGNQQPTPYPAPLSLDDLLGMGRGDDVPAMGTPSGISASVIANTRPVSWVFAGLFGGFVGFGHGSMMVTNAFTGGVIPGLDRDVKNIIQENGGAYAAANFSANVGATAYNFANVGAGALQLANIAKGGQALVTTTGRLLPSAAAVAGIAEGSTQVAVGVGISVAATGNLPPNFAMMFAGPGGGAGGGAPKGLPATTEASVADKLERYLLNPDHPVGRPKANWFQQALGFTKENAADLATQIKFNEAAATVTGVTEHGTKFNQVITIIGANGKSIDVTFAWIRNNDGVVRLVTSIPTPR